MIGPSPSERQLGDVLRFADEHGLHESLESIRELCRCLGVAGARQRLMRVTRVLDLGLVHGIVPDVAAARRCLSACGEDVVAAVERMRRRHHGETAEITSAQLRERTQDLGVPLTVSTARRYCARHADPEAHVRDIAAIQDGACLVGIDLCWQDAACRLAAAGNAEEAVGRLRRQAHRRRRRLSQVCQLRHPLRGTHAEQTDAIARCACRGCSARMIGQLQAYTARVLREEHVAESDELRQIAHEAIVEALDDWREQCGFATYYSGVIGNRLKALGRARTAMRSAFGEPQSLSWDARLDGDARRVGLLERIPDRNVDVPAIVIAHERVREDHRSRKKAIVDRVVAYEEERKAA